MEKTWAISGVDLHVDVPRSRIRAGLEAAVRDAVRSGRLASDTRLPSSRSLASDLGIARNTVADAYTQLVAEGWLVARPGSGTRVADRQRAAAGSHRVGAIDAMDATKPLRYDLRVGRPDVSAFPRATWLAASRRALATAPPSTLGYADPQGLPVLRAAVAEYVARVRGVHADPDRIVICSGFSQGIGLLAEVLAARGGRVLAVEDCSHDHHRTVAAGRGLRIAPVRLDESGMVVNDLGSAAAVLTTPAHQFPLGMVLAAERRSQLIAWSARTGGLVIEDDYDGEFRYDRHPVGAMQPLAPESVVYAGTASKALVPGLRLGWLVVPDRLVADLVEAKSRADTQSSTLDQLGLAEFIRGGHYDKQVRRTRIGYRRRRDRLMTMLADRVPEVHVDEVAAGLHVVGWLPEGVDEETVIEAARTRGVAIQGLSGFVVRPGSYPAGIVIGYGSPPDHAFTGAIARSVAALRSVIDASSPSDRRFQPSDGGF